MGKEEQVASAERVRRDTHGDVAVLTIENPPLATLTPEVRQALYSALEAVEADEAVAGVVITGIGNVFASGAAASATDDDNAPDLAGLCDRIEAMKKPVVAAIQGAALGGGLELALAAHLRVSCANVRLGSPEITVGLVPGAGGTQRLPKVIGGIAALKMLLSGRAISGGNAAKLGLVDVLAVGDVQDEAVAAARRLAAAGGELRRSSQRRDRLGEGTAFLEAVAAHRRLAAQSPLEAPTRMIECVEAALLLPYDIGRGLEQSAYEDLVQSDHSRSLRHIFAAERELQAATRWEGRVMSRPLKSVAILGAQGTGAEMAVLCMDAGFDVIVAEDSDQALETGVARIIEHFEARVAAGKMTEDAVERILDRLQAVSGFSTLSEADIVFDPNPGTSKERLAEIDTAMRTGSVLALSTEGADVGTLADMTKRAPDVLGLRFAAGLRRNRLVEFAAPKSAGARPVATARALMRKLDRLILDTGTTVEGVGTRLMEALHAAADLCLEDGARVNQIDAALRDWGIPHGSFGYRDIVGLARQSAPKGLGGQRGSGLDEGLAAAGRLGLATGRGYYVYQERGKPGIENPEIAAMAEADRTVKGIRPRVLDDGEVRKRCLAAMAGAGAQILAEDVVRRPADIDMVAVHALGFARRTGGIMFAADLLGLEEVRKLLLQMSQASSRIQEPPAMLQALIKSEKEFDDLNS